MDINKVCYFLITGASRGIGQTMAIECAKKFKSGSVVVLLARSMDGLKVTQKKILASNPEITVKTYSIDLTAPSAENLKHIITDSLGNKTIQNFDIAFIIHNAASTGNITKKASALADMDEWTEYYKFNVFSVATLNSIFLKEFASIRKIVVNITSACGIEPFNSLTLYCTGKAAREMYFRVLAQEEPEIVVLNYSPGPVDTDMTIDIQKNSVDEGLRTYFENSRKEKTILTTDETTMKFLKVLEDFKFKSGDHVDYFD